MSASTPSFYAYRTPLGIVTMRADDAGITDVAFGDVLFDGERRPSELTNRTANELLEFLAGKRRLFGVPTSLSGSPFQHAVWKALANVPYGETRTSAQIAEAIGKPTSYRAVGNAARRNPVPVLVPSHRIVDANGRPLGVGIEARRASELLSIEQLHAN